MSLKRNAYKKLLEWRLSENHLPLLLRGARQVGKTTLVRDFSKEFTHYLELNLERDLDKTIIDKTDNVKDLLNAIALYKKVNLTKKPTLLFIDEIQESPKAIQLLRYFLEDLPHIYVIAAGSLLEFALKKVPSFPVGRIDYLHLNPINFDEYLNNTNSSAKNLLDQIPIPKYAHELILKEFHRYAIIGGMPQVVSNYVEDENISDLKIIYRRLWQAYKDDVEKYANSSTQKTIIRHIIDSAPNELDRIKFEGFGQSNYNSKEVGEGLRTLNLSRIIQLIYPTTNLEPPLTPNLKKRPRLQFLDTGLLNQVLNIQGEMIGLDDLNSLFKGRIIQHLVYQEFLSIHDFPGFIPHFWVREEKDGNAEVDLIVQHKNLLIPVEVKSGKTGTLRSLHQFIDRCNHSFAIRLYAGNLSVESAKTPKGKEYTLLNLPYYLATKLPEYIEYLVDLNKD